MKDHDAALMELVRAIAAGDDAGALRLLKTRRDLAQARFERGATRQNANAFYLKEAQHYVYAGDTALHVAAAAYRVKVARKLIERGADVRAKNRRGAEPLHYAADGTPGSPAWDPRAQAATIVRLVAGGADPNATDQGGVTPLHRAVRTRCAAAVEALLDSGADPQRKNDSGSTPIQLAAIQSGRGGSGSAAAKAQQAQIVRLLDAPNH